MTVTHYTTKELTAIIDTKSQRDEEGIMPDLVDIMRLEQYSHVRNGGRHYSRDKRLDYIYDDIDRMKRDQQERAAVK